MARPLTTETFLNVRSPVRLTKITRVLNPPLIVRPFVAGPSIVTALSISSCEERTIVVDADVLTRLPEELHPFVTTSASTAATAPDADPPPAKK